MSEERSCLVVLKAEDKFKALEDIVKKSPLFEALDRNALLSSIIKREREQSTYIGHGVLIAHGRLKGLNDIKIALAISEEGITGDREPIHLLFAIASPEEQPTLYLKSISAILSWVHNSDFRARLSRSDYKDKSVALFYKMLKSQHFTQYEESHLSTHQC